MKKIIIITFLSLGCSLPESIEEGNKCNFSFIPYQLHPVVNMQISLPSNWSTIDTVRYGMHKHLIRTVSIHNSDSTSTFFLYVTDVKNDWKRKTDTSTLKSELRSIANINNVDKDSIIGVWTRVIKGWNTAFQKTIKKNDKSWQGGQIISALDSKQVEIRFETNSRDSAMAAQVIGCIMDSFTIND